MSDKRWIVKQSIFLTLIGILASITSLLKEAVFANYFGTTFQADAFTIAIQIPEVLFAVIWESIVAILIPLYSNKLYTEGKKQAKLFICNLTTVIVMIVVILIIICEVFSDNIIYIFSPGLESATHNLAAKLFKYIVPMLLFESIIRIANGILSVHNKFLIPRILNSIRNITMLFFIIFFANKFGIVMAAFGILTGMFIEAICHIIYTKPFERYNLYLNFHDKTLQKAGKMIVPIILNVGIGQINQLFDKFIASFLVTGSIVSLNYASKLSSLIQSLILGNIATIMYPNFSKLISQNNIDELNKSFLYSLKVTCLLGIPIVFGGGILSLEIISLIFERGCFDVGSTIIVSEIFVYYLIGTTFIALQLLCIKLFTSFGDTKTPMTAALIGAFINIMLNIILAKRFGVAGLALATSISNAIVTVIVMCLIRKKTTISYKSFLVTCVKSFFASVVMGISILLIKCLGVNCFNIHNTFQNLIFIIFLIFIGMVIYGIILLVLKDNETKNIVRYLLNKIKKQSK